MQLHWRMATIRNELEILENPDMRKICEQNQHNSMVTTTTPENIATAHQSVGNVFMVTKVAQPTEHIRYLQALEKIMGDNNSSNVQLCPTLLVSFVAFNVSFILINNMDCCCRIVYVKVQWQRRFMCRPVCTL